MCLFGIFHEVENTLSTNLSNFGLWNSRLTIF